MRGSVSDGFGEESCLLDFPTRDRKTVLHVRRRRWTMPDDTTKSVDLDRKIQLKHPGTRYSKDLALFKRERIAAGKVAEVEQHIDLRQWLDGFGDTEKSVRATMLRVKNHPLVPDNIIVRGFIIDSTTGELTEIGE